MKKPYRPQHGHRSATIAAATTTPRFAMSRSAPPSPRSPLSELGGCGGGAAARRILAPLLLLAALSLPCAVLYLAASPSVPLPLLSPPINVSAVTVSASAAVDGDDPADEPDLDDEQVRLERVLMKAAMKDGTVILTTLNAAWALPGSVVDLFIESFRIGNGTRSLLEHLVIVALDRKAYVRCMSIHENCFALTTEGVDFSGEKGFMSSGYLKMMWRRIDFLRVVLEMGHSFIFTDTDIMWFRNPFPHFHPDGDFQIACDHFVGNATDLQNMPNGGFNYVKSNQRTIEFYKFWYASREDYPGSHDQDVLNFIKHDPFIKEIGLRMRFLSTVYFGGICEPSRDLYKVCTMHANCCIGLLSKLHDLRIMLEDWRRFMALPPLIKKARVLSWRVPQNCSLHLRQ